MLGKPCKVRGLAAPRPPPPMPSQAPFVRTEARLAFCKKEALKGDFLKGGYAEVESGRTEAHKHKLFAQVNVQMALGQTARCPRVNRAKKFMCSPRNTGNINFSLWLTGRLSQGCPDFQ